MMHTEQALYDELRVTLSKVDKQIKVVVNGSALENTVEMSSLLVSRAQILNGMAALKAASTSRAMPVRGKR